MTDSGLLRQALGLALPVLLLTEYDIATELHR